MKIRIFPVCFFGILMLDVFMPAKLLLNKYIYKYIIIYIKHYLYILLIYILPYILAVLKPEDSCPWGSQKLSKGCDIFGKSISTSSTSFCCFSKIAFPEDRLHQFSFPTFPVMITLLLLIKERSATHPLESFKVLFPRI